MKEGKKAFNAMTGWKHMYYVCHMWSLEMGTKNTNIFGKTCSEHVDLLQVTANFALPQWCNASP